MMDGRKLNHPFFFYSLDKGGLFLWEWKIGE